MATNHENNPVCVVVGAGDALGSAICQRFAREGYFVCPARRNKSGSDLDRLLNEIISAGGQTEGFTLDAREEEEVQRVFQHIEHHIGPIEVMVFNVGGNVRFPVVETTSRVYRKVWEMGAFAGFLCGREAAKRMLPRKRGTIILTGATASVRGAPGFSAFAGAKHALRAFAQSLAKEVGPAGIHVAHTIIDGAIDTAFIRELFPDRYELKDEDGILNPEHIAENYWQLHRQPRDAWTFEMDLRPWMEAW